MVDLMHVLMHDNDHCCLELAWLPVYSLLVSDMFSNLASKLRVQSTMVMRDINMTQCWVGAASNQLHSAVLLARVRMRAQHELHCPYLVLLEFLQTLNLFLQLLYPFHHLVGQTLKL
jgi:hypothetical protein